MAGLFAANLLHRSGWDVHVFERSRSELSGRGAGIVTHDGLLYALSSCGAQVDSQLGVEIHKRLAISKDGDRLAQCDFQQVLTSWSRLLDYLKVAFPSENYQLNQEVVSISPGDLKEPATIRFANGHSLSADLVIAADGLKSTCRRILDVESKQAYAGYVAWRAVCDLSLLSEASKALMGDTFLFSQRPGEQILAYPIAGPDSADQVLVNLVWYRKTNEEKLKDLLTGHDGTYYADGIPPQKIQSSHIADIQACADELFHICWAEHLRQAESIILQPIFDSEIQSMCAGRVAFIGDSAFVARPHVGQGVTKAAGDALCLDRHLRGTAIEEIPTSLSSFSEERLTVGRMAVEHARQMGAPVVISPFLKDGGNWENYYSQPENLIRDTAVELEGVVKKDEAPVFE